MPIQDSSKQRPRGRRRTEDKLDLDELTTAPNLGGMLSFLSVTPAEAKRRQEMREAIEAGRVGGTVGLSTTVAEQTPPNAAVSSLDGRVDDQGARRFPSLPHGKQVTSPEHDTGGVEPTEISNATTVGLSTTVVASTTPDAVVSHIDPGARHFPSLPHEKPVASPDYTGGSRPTVAVRPTEVVHATVGPQTNDSELSNKHISSLTDNTPVVLRPTVAIKPMVDQIATVVDRPTVVDIPTVGHPWDASENSSDAVNNKFTVGLSTTVGHTHTGGHHTTVGLSGADVDMQPPSHRTEDSEHIAIHRPTVGHRSTVGPSGLDRAFFNKEEDLPRHSAKHAVGEPIILKLKSNDLAYPPIVRDGTPVSHDTDTVVDRPPVPETLVIKDAVAKARVFRATLVQHGHTPAEQLLYLALWNNGRQAKDGSREITAGYRQLAHVANLNDKTVKYALQSLIEKLAIEVIAEEHVATRTGRTYCIYSYEQILARRNRAGLLWVRKNKGVEFVAPPL